MLIGKRYEVIKQLEGGSTGIILLTHDRVSGEPRVLKKLPELDDSALNEFHILRRLQHPNLVRIYDLVRDQDDVYLSQEYLQGNALGYREQAAGDTSVNDDSLKTLLQCLLPVLRALAFLHNKGIIHGDIKPSNLIVTNQEPKTDNQKPVIKLIDFGLAKLQNPQSSMHSAVRIPQSQIQASGTLAYMDPELIEGKPADQRSDLYSLGISLYEIITGRLPFNLSSESNLREIYVILVPYEIIYPYKIRVL